LSWEQPYGLAYNYTIESLRRSLHNLRALYDQPPLRIEVPEEEEQEGGEDDG
jgi:hypothetical protein